MTKPMDSFAIVQRCTRMIADFGSLPFNFIVTFPLNDPRPLRATQQVLYHRVLRDLRSRGDDPLTPPPPHRLGSPGRGHIYPSRTPLARPDDWGGHSVSGTQQSALGHPSTSGPCRTTSAPVPPSRLRPHGGPLF